jgi:superfamily II DNA or RNA helicase
VSADPAEVPTPGTSRFLPRIHLFVERFLVEGARGDQEVELPVLSLVFDYGGTALRANDPRDRFFAATDAGMSEVERDRPAEVRFQCLLESLGAVEVEQAEDYTPPFDSPADYLVQLGGNVHGYCSFTAFALRELTLQGCVVTIDKDYPYQVVDDDPPWSLSIEPESGHIDWFSMQLGIDAEGRRIDLLPVLLDTINEHKDGQSLSSLLSLPARRRAIAVGPNRYVTLPPDRFRSLLQVVLELYRGDRTKNNGLRIGRMQCGSLARLCNVFEAGGGLRIDSGAQLVEQGRLLTGSRPANICEAPLELTVTLRSYQAEGLAWLQRLRSLSLGGVLADDMGLGKTLQTIAHLLTEAREGRMDRPSLVVVPTSLVDNWVRELARFAPSLRVVRYQGPKRASVAGALSTAQILITTYPVLIRDQEVLAPLEYHYVILDEAQAIKNHRSQSAAAVKSLNTRHRLCLSGTPVENNLDELWSLFDFVMPALLGKIASFKQRFRHPIERGGDQTRLLALRERVSPFVLRRMKEQVAKELPPKTELLRPVELEGAQRDLYESIRLAAHADVRKAIRGKGVSGSAITILDALMKLRQVCCDPRLVRLPSARNVEESAKRSLFFELLTGQLKEGRRVLVFSQFAQMLAILSEGLLERGIRHVTLTGQVPDRQRRIDAFQKGEVDVFLISLKAGGTGLNLTRADTVIHYDPWWNAAAQLQATDRAYRIGQTKPVFVHSLIVAGGVEERIVALQQRKRCLSDSLFGNDENGQKGIFDFAEIEHLLAPLDD